MLAHGRKPNRGYPIIRSTPAATGQPRMTSFGVRQTAGQSVGTVVRLCDSRLVEHELHDPAPADVHPRPAAMCEDAAVVAPGVLERVG